MSRAKLYVNYAEVDLSEKEVVALSFSVNKMNDIESRSGHYSNTFSILDTKNNRAALGLPAELNNLDSRRWGRLVAWIDVGSTLVMYGFAELVSVSDKLSINVYGGNTDWIDAIRGKKLSDIDFSDLDHATDAATVTANRFNDYTSHYVYPDVDYGLLQTIEGSVPPWFLYPAVFVRSIIDRTFSAAGWTLENELESEDVFNKLIMPFSNTEVFHTDQWVEDRGFNAHISTHSAVHTDPTATWFIGLDNDSTGAYYDNGGQITLGAWATGVNIAGYQPNDHIHQTFTCSLTFEVTFWDAVNSSFTVNFANGGINAENYVHTAGTGTFTIEISAETTEQLDETIIIYIKDISVDVTDGHFTTEVHDTHYRDSTWEVGVNMPDMLQTDLIKFVANAFSCLLIADEPNKTLKISKLDHVPKKKVEDWSSKIDLSERPTIIPKFGDYVRENVLKYSNDAEDQFLEVDEALGDYTILNTHKDRGKKTAYEAPFSLIARSLTMNETMTKAAIHLHDTEVGSVGIDYQNKTITGITNAGLITLTGGADDFEEGDLITLRNLNGNQQYNGLSIDEMRFKIVAIKDSTHIDLNKTFTGSTAATSGNVYRGVHNVTVAVNDSSKIEAGYDILFANTNGNQTIEGVSIEGNFMPVSKTTPKDVLIPDAISGSTPTTSGRVHYIKEFTKRRKTPPRIGVHEVVAGSSSLIQIVGASTVTDASEVYFDDILWPQLVSDHWQVQNQIIPEPQAVKCLMRLNASDINQLDFTRPKWIEHFGCMFYLSFVSQYKVNEVDSTEVELVKLPA